MKHPWLQAGAHTSIPVKPLGRRSTSDSIDKQLGNYETSMRERFSRASSKLKAVSAFSESARRLSLQGGGAKADDVQADLQELKHKQEQTEEKKNNK